MSKGQSKQKPAPPKKISQVLPGIRKRQRFAFVADNLFVEACAYIASGMSIVQVSKLPGMPNQLSFFRKVAESDINRQIYLRAKEAGMLVFAEDVLAIADNVKGDAYRDKLRIDTRFRLMGSFARPLFGDNVQIEGNPNKPIVIKWLDGPSPGSVPGDNAKLIDGRADGRAEVIDHKE